MPAGTGCPPGSTWPGKALLIRVNDAGARYPLTVDPFFQQAKLTASDFVDGDEFGFSVAVSGSTIVVGSPLAAGVLPGHYHDGAVYVFVKPAGGWANGTQTAKLTGSDAGSIDELGVSVAISGDTIVAGAPMSRAAPPASSSSRPAAGRAVPRRPRSPLPTPSTGISRRLGCDRGRHDRGRSFRRTSTRSRGLPSPGRGVRIRQAGWRLGERDGDGQADRLRRCLRADGLGSSVAISGDTIVAGPRPESRAMPTRALPTSSSSRRGLDERDADGEARSPRTGPQVTPSAAPSRAGGCDRRRRFGGGCIGSCRPGGRLRLRQAGRELDERDETAKLTASDGAASDLWAGLSRSRATRSSQASSRTGGFHRNRAPPTSSSSRPAAGRAGRRRPS